MPAAGWRTHKRDPALVERDLVRFRKRNRHLFPQLEATPDLGRGAMRLAAEVLMDELQGRDVPSFAHERAIETLAVLARG